MESNLVERARGGDRGAFARLVEPRWDRLVRRARSVVGEGEAEDAVQDGLVLAWGKLGSLAKPQAFAAWLDRVVLRCCLRRVRRRPLLVPIAEVPEPSHTGNPGAAVDVARALAALAPQQRAVMHLTVVEGMSDGEIATLMGIAAASVRAHRRRAREKLARIFEPACAHGS